MLQADVHAAAIEKRASCVDLVAAAIARHFHVILRTAIKMASCNTCSVPMPLPGATLPPSEGADGALTGQRAAIFDIDVGRHRTVDRQHALFHPGITAIGVITQQRQRTGARFGQAAVPADVVTPRIEVAFARRSAAQQRYRVRRYFPDRGYSPRTVFHCRSPVHNIPAGYPLW